ncbi:MAG TPA: bacteriohemerythrin [Kiloniellales bacterium]|nr:bacteriohemerythrin [Kiloniellales bacterium]
MALIEWRETFKVGVPSVDHEHEELIALLNRLHEQLKSREEAAGDKETVLRFLGEVHAGIAAHFALEEQIMRECGYDQYADHKADHERLLDEIREIMDRYEAAADTDYEGELSQHLRDWFTVHFRTKDARLHRMIG